LFSNWMQEAIFEGRYVDIVSDGAAVATAVQSKSMGWERHDVGDIGNADCVGWRISVRDCGRLEVVVK